MLSQYHLCDNLYYVDMVPANHAEIGGLTDTASVTIYTNVDVILTNHAEIGKLASTTSVTIYTT